jgi:hypothetical protein
VTVDDAHAALEAELDQAREAWQSALESREFTAAEAAYTRLAELLELYIHLPQQRRPASPTSVPVPPTTTT